MLTVSPTTCRVSDDSTPRTQSADDVRHHAGLHEFLACRLLLAHDHRQGLQHRLLVLLGVQEPQVRSNE